MLAVIGSPSLDALIEEVVPPKIRSQAPLALPPSRSETDVLAELKQVAGRNKVYRSYIGQGYYGTQTPNVVLRNILENPAWYTAYTPYQPEISQGRLEALLNYQTMVADLTGLDISNASLLDESTAAAEAMTLARRSAKSKSPVFFISRHVHPQTIEVVRTRAEGLDIEIAVGDEAEGLPECFGVLLQYPHSTGSVADYRKLADAAHAQGAVVAVATDLLALAVLAAPGEGADIAVGSAQRFGVPFGFGGPHAGFMACKDAYKRNMAGRLVGVSRTRRAIRPCAWRCKRASSTSAAKATSNICTAQVLLAVMAGMYAVWHGPAGIRRIANRVNRYTAILRAELVKLGVKVANDSFFDTLLLETGAATPAILTAADCAHVNLRRVDARAWPSRWTRPSPPPTCRPWSTCSPPAWNAMMSSWTRARRRGRQRHSRRRGPRKRHPEASGVLQRAVGNRHAALPAQAGRQGPGAGPHHDPAGLVHHEAERHGRDDPHHLARVRADPPSRPPRRARATRN